MLSAIALVEGNLSYQIGKGLPLRAPSFFLADIRQDQKPELEKFLQSRKEISDIRVVPLLRAPLMRINDKPLDVYAKKADEDSAWVLRGDRGLTYAALPPPNNEIVEGAWWQEIIKDRPCCL